MFTISHYRFAVDAVFRNLTLIKNISIKILLTVKFFSMINHVINRQLPQL